MDGPTTVKPPSSSVGNYLKAIWELSREGTASTKDVAERLSISSASVSNMFVRLREMGLAEYERYQGPAAAQAPPPDRDLPVGMPRLLLGRGARGGRAPGALGLGRLHRAPGGVPGASRLRSPRRSHPSGGWHAGAG